MHISIVPYVAEHVIQNTNLDQMSLIEICEKLKLLHSEILSMEICTKIGKNLKWEKYSHDEKIQLGDAGSWTDFWEETASHIEWDTLSREEMLFIHNEKSLGKGTICPMVKTGKLSLDDIIEISFSNEFFMREEDFKNLSNSIKWESFTKDDLEKLIKASRFDGIFESPLIHRAIEELGKK